MFTNVSVTTDFQREILYYCFNLFDKIFPILLGSKILEWPTSTYFQGQECAAVGSIIFWKVERYWLSYIWEKALSFNLMLFSKGNEAGMRSEVVIEFAYPPRNKKFLNLRNTGYCFRH